MWLISGLFSKTKNNECQDTQNQQSSSEAEDNEDKANKDKVNEEKVNECKVNEDKVKEESIKVEEEPTIKCELQKRVEQVKIIHNNLQALQNKQDSNENCSDAANTKKTEGINNCKIDAVLRIIPVIETNLQTLTDKVSCLSGLISTKQLQAQTVTETVTDQNIVLNSANTINNLQSVNKSNDMENTTTPKNKVKPLGKVSKKNKKTTKSKLTKKKKKKVEPEASPTETINQNEQVKNSENAAEDGAKPVEQLTNYLDGRLECFFTKIQSALSKFQTNQINEKCEIMVHLSGLDNKMNANEMNIDKLVSNVQQLRKKSEQVIVKKQSSTKIENKQELQKSIDDIKMCIDYLVHPNAIESKPAKQCTHATPNRDVKSACASNRCVCQLIDNTKYSNANAVQIRKSNDGNYQRKYDDIILCEFLKAKLHMLKRSEDQNRAQVNPFSNKTDCKSTGPPSVCPKKPNHNTNACCGKQIVDRKTSNVSKNLVQISNNCVKNQIENNTTVNLLENAKKLSNLNNNCGQKPNEEQKTNHLAIVPKPSVHHFSKNCAENDGKSYRPKKSVCEKNQICEFLSSQPIPEWIRRSQQVAPISPCRNPLPPPPTNNCQQNAGNKLYNVERIVKDGCDKSATGSGVAYEITQKQDAPPDKNKKNCGCGGGVGGTSKEHDLAPCNSLDSVKSVKDSPWHVKR